MTSASEKQPATGGTAGGEDQLIRMEDAAELLDVSRERVYALAAPGVAIGEQIVKLQVVVMGERRIRTTRRWVREYQETCTRLWHLFKAQQQADRQAKAAKRTKLAVGDREAAKRLRQLGAS